MSRYMKAILIMLALILYVGLVLGQDIEVGKSIFDSKCGSCHKIEGIGIGPNIGILSSKESNYIKQIVRNGIPNTAMKAFSINDLSDNELADVIAYIESTNTSKNLANETAKQTALPPITPSSTTQKSPGFEIFLGIIGILSIYNYNFRHRK